MTPIEKEETSIGAQIITNTFVGVPSYNYSIIYPKNLLKERVRAGNHRICKRRQSKVFRIYPEAPIRIAKATGLQKDRWPVVAYSEVQLRGYSLEEAFKAGKDICSQALREASGFTV